MPHSGRGFVAMAFHTSDVLEAVLSSNSVMTVGVRSFSSAVVAGSSSVAMVATSRWWEVVPRL